LNKKQHIHVVKSSTAQPIASHDASLRNTP
jgi:hypothetical protein